MRVCIITYRYGGPGGIESIAAELSGALSAKGEEISIITARPNVHLCGTTMHRVSAISGIGTLRHLTFYLASTMKVRSLQGFDIIHSFGMTGRFNVFAAQSCHKAGLRILKGYERSLVENPFGAGIANEVALRQERRNFLGPSVRKIIACSHGTKREIVEEYGADERTIAVIPNGVDSVRFSRTPDKIGRGRSLFREFGIPHSSPVIIFIANEFARKGLAALLRSIPSVSGTDPVLLVVGKGNKKPYMDLAARLGLAQRLFFAGVRDDVECLLAAADVFVLPTLHEAFGLAVLEAMAVGVPVVASACAGAIEDLGRDGENCIALRSPDQPEEIAAAIQKLFDDGNLRKKLAAGGVRTAQDYSWSEIARRTIGVYKELL